MLLPLNDRIALELGRTMMRAVIAEARGALLEERIAADPAEPAPEPPAPTAET